MSDNEQPTEQTVEAWAKQTKTPAPQLAAARVINRWGIGRMLTEAEFQAGLEAENRVTFK